MKLAIISTHPIQYNAPFFRLLQEQKVAEVKVFYTWGQSVLENKFDPGFNKTIEWDIPLLEGYSYSFPENTAVEKGSHHFKGIINPGLIDELESYDPAAILVYGWSFQSHLHVMRHFKGRKTIIMRGDSTLIDASAMYKQWVRTLFLRWVYRHADYALFVGRRNFEYYKKMGMRDKQLVWGPHAIDNTRFAGEDAIRSQQALALRRELKIPEQAIVLLFAGKLEEKKDPALLLKAFTESDVCAKAFLVIVGNGNLEKMLKEQYQQHPSIRFMDFQNQSMMPVIYRLGDLLVLPSKGPGETWGLAVNEAMASGRAVLVSDRCGCAPDLVKPGTNGYVVKAGDLDDLKEKLQLLAGDKSELIRMGLASGKMIADFSYNQSAEALKGLLQKIA